jgi:vitamin B12 transporter
MIRCVWMIAALVMMMGGGGVAVSAAQAGQQQASISGAVLDSLGARVPGAMVALMRDGQQAAEVTATADGSYTFANLMSGRYQVMARATGFEAQTSEPVYVGAGSSAAVDVTLQIGTLQQGVVVTASAAIIPQSQSGAPVTVIGEDMLNAINKPDLLEALRLVPGAQVHQTAGRGGTTSLFIRGGNSNFAKILIDGIPANDIGGGFDFSQMATTGVSRVEVLRQSNSVVYGADALAGVVNIETKRGRTRVPEVGYSIDGGNLGTFRNALSLGGAIKRFDYFSEYSFLKTDNSVPNNAYENKTYAGRFGVKLGNRTDLSGIIRRVNGDYESPNAFSLFQVADDSSQTVEMTYAGITAQSQWSDRFQTTVRVGNSDQTSVFRNPAPSGEAFDPFGFGANYLGRRVTITGANGYSTTGRAILDFGGTYPSVFRTRTARRALYGQATYTIARDVSVSAGGRVEREQGFSNPDADPTTTRNNGGLFVEGRGTVGGRTYLTGGVGYEHNESFESVVTPRLSIATYLRTPALGAIGDTKLSFNAGRGIKAPAVFQVDSSLFTLLQEVPNAPAIGPISPEKGTSIDIGLEQGFWDGQARVRVAWFRNTYEDLIEFVSKNVLPQVGVPTSVAQATAFGAYVNSQSYDASGLELSGETLLAGRLRLMASYTFLDAEVTESFGSGALSPATNPAIPGVRIGAFSPLIGARPFRRPTHSGTFMVSYTAGPAQVALSSYFSGVRDDSTFLSDANFGNSMLLPNQGLDAAYQKFDLSGSYQLHRRVKPYVSIENLFDKEYEAAFGYPSLPRTARVGLTLTLGGD